MYSPSPIEILSSQPRFNTFYRAPAHVTKYVSQIADRARQNEGLDNSYIFKTVQAIAFSPWNHHIAYSIRGYENYGFEGPQYLKKYGPDPLSQPNTGNEYPVIWIPDPDNPREPGEIFAPQAPPVGQDEITFAPEPAPEPISEEVARELVDFTRPTVVIEPMTAEAQEIALTVVNLPTEEEAELLQYAYMISEDAAEIIDDPNSTPEQKEAAIKEVANLARDMGVADEETISAIEEEAIDTVYLEAEQQQPQYTEVIEYGPPYDPETDSQTMVTEESLLPGGLRYTGREAGFTGIGFVLGMILAQAIVNRY